MKLWSYEALRIVVLDLARMVIFVTGEYHHCDALKPRIGVDTRFQLRGWNCAQFLFLFQNHMIEWVGVWICRGPWRTWRSFTVASRPWLLLSSIGKQKDWPRSVRSALMQPTLNLCYWTMAWQWTKWLAWAGTASTFQACIVFYVLKPSPKQFSTRQSLISLGFYNRDASINFFKAELLILCQ